MIILYAVPIFRWPMLGKEKRYFILGTLTIMTFDEKRNERKISTIPTKK